MLYKDHILVSITVVLKLWDINITLPVIGADRVHTRNELLQFACEQVENIFFMWTTIHTRSF